MDSGLTLGVHTDETPLFLAVFNNIFQAGLKEIMSVIRKKTLFFKFLGSISADFLSPVGQHGLFSRAAAGICAFKWYL